jgi:hypothetical protein
MTDARRALIWFAAFIAVVIGGDRLLSWTLSRILVRSQFRYSRLYRGGIDADVLILGDSRGVHSFYAPAIEELTGLRAFNASYNSMSMRIAEAVLLDYLDRNRQPRIAIIEVTGVAFEGELTSELRTYANFSPRLSALYAEAHPSAAAAGRTFHLLNLNSGFYLESLHYMRRSDQDWINHSAMPPAMRNAAPQAWRLPTPENLAALNRMIQALRRRGGEVRLVLAPYFPAPTNMGEFAQIVERSSGMPVRNYAGAITDPEDFADTVHLNERGSRTLLALMKRDGLFGMTRPPRVSGFSPTFKPDD